MKESNVISKQIIEEAIREFVRTSPLNRLESFGGVPIFDEPLIGFADGDDPLFEQFKKVVHESHLPPREILGRHLEEKLKTASPAPAHVSVISFVLPVSEETRTSNAREKEGPSLRWNHTRWKGQEFIQVLSRHLVSFLEERGANAVAPDLTPHFKMIRLQDGYASTWSQRHAAFAAGLGTFSLSDAFITSRGSAMRCGSVVTDLKLEPSPRPYAGHLENCLFYATGKSGVCIDRCPRGAISERGHDQRRCNEILFKDQKPWLEGAHGPGYIGQYAGCGLCQTGVPCESRIPVSRRGEAKKQTA